MFRTIGCGCRKLLNEYHAGELRHSNHILLEPWKGFLMISCHSRELKTIYCIIGNNNFIHTYHVTKILHYKPIDIIRLSQPWWMAIWTIFRTILNNDLKVWNHFLILWPWHFESVFQFNIFDSGFQFFLFLWDRFKFSLVDFYKSSIDRVLK